MYAQGLNSLLVTRDITRVMSLSNDNHVKCMSKKAHIGET